MAALQDATNEGKESLENNLFSWADPSPLFRGLVNAIAELGGLGADSAAGQQEIEEGGDKLQITGSSGNRLELVVPPTNTPPCSLIQVEMPATGVCLYMYIHF
jgi:hypothetical protein